MKQMLIIISIIAMTLVSCSETGLTPVGFIDTLTVSQAEPDTLLELTTQQADSLEFRLMHHYTNNYNFIVKADSLILSPREDEMGTASIVRKDDIVAVADIRQLDTIWIKIARDQFTMGWINEEELLKGVIPNDILSQIINTLTGSRMVWMSIMVALGIIGFIIRRKSKNGLHILNFDDMSSFYPMLLLILVSDLACVYASIQEYAPEFWQEYYYHPTLNPMILPPSIGTLVVLVWAVVIVFVAILFEVYHNLPFLAGIAYTLELLGTAMISYLVISWTTNFYVGYILLAAYTIALIWLYFTHVRCRYKCGACGKKMKTKGICPKCGQLNK